MRCDYYKLDLAIESVSSAHPVGNEQRAPKAVACRVRRWRVSRKVCENMTLALSAVRREQTGAMRDAERSYLEISPDNNNKNKRNTHVSVAP